MKHIIMESTFPKIFESEESINQFILETGCEIKKMEADGKLYLIIDEDKKIKEPETVPNK